MCLAGVNIRYLADIALVTALISTTVISKFVSLEKRTSQSLNFAIYAVSCLLLLLTIMIGLFLVFINERNNLLNLIYD